MNDVEILIAGITIIVAPFLIVGFFFFLGWLTNGEPFWCKIGLHSHYWTGPEDARGYYCNNCGKRLKSFQ